MRHRGTPSRLPASTSHRRRRPILRTLVAGLILLAGSAGIGLATALVQPGPAFADGPAPCTVGGPPFPFAGFCATYSGANTWYGSYGPGFPTDEGWGFCADPPASGGDYPAPDYDYVSSPPPSGASTSETGALGFAFSEAEALGWWGGVPGQFTSDQAAVAGKLLYDAVIWASPVPAMDPGVLAAYQALLNWYEEAVGTTGSPQLTIGLVGGGVTFTGSATYVVTAAFPGTDSPVVGLPVELSVQGATLNSDAGPTTLTESTDSSGQAAFSIVSPTPATVSATTTVAGGLGQAALSFFAPTARELGAQLLAAFSAPTAFLSNQQLTALPTTGTVSVVKGGDDTAYYPVGGAVFDVMSGSTLVATLTTGADGTSPVSGQLPAGTYTVHEEMAPAGYGLAADQTVDVTAGTNTVVSFTGAAEDHVTPATVEIDKSDSQTGSPLAGANFDIAYDQSNDGTYRDIGTCTTSATGSCTPVGNDGPSELLPGRYRITETSPPPGYAVSDPSTQEIDLLAGESGTVTFGDPRLVSAVFQKVATGNINPAELVLDGAVIELYQGSPNGPSTASCSTTAAGTCVTPAALKSGTRYCWAELVAPPGLVGGANGCFTADNSQADEPINVTDPGEFVAIDVKKVDAANPSVGLPGAVFDLYQVAQPAIASAAPFPNGSAGANEVLVATVTTASDGVGAFPLQLPGYAYCAVETQAPANYDPDPSSQCTGVLVGSTVVPPSVTTLTFKDSEQKVDLAIFKYNSLTPNTGIPGAVYDLYVEGPPPPSGVDGTPPSDVMDESGDTWYARGTTGSDGHLSFTVPAGYAWCVREVTAPLDYTLDRALHCSAVLTTSSDEQALTIAIPEERATVHVTAYKYNSTQPNTVIPGATYELLANGSQPPGSPADPPANATVPSGDTFFAEGTTDENGVLSFAVPAGFSWCLHELVAPASYATDPGYHCTAVLTTDTSSAAATVAVPEIPLTASLPFTGFPGLLMGGIGVGLVTGGLGLVLVDRRRVRGSSISRRHRSHGVR